MELVTGMMDGSFSYELKNRLEPVVSGSGVQREANLELKEVPMFEGCSERQLRSIARIARVFDAPTGTVITRVGEPGNEFYLILDGTVSVDLSVGKPVSLRPGEFFGYISLAVSRLADDCDRRLLSTERQGVHLETWETSLQLSSVWSINREKRHGAIADL